MYAKLLRRSAATIKFELMSHLCLIVGLAKARLHTNTRAVRNVEIGAGGSRRPGFITVDLSLRSDVPFDLRAGLPFRSESVDLIYAEHVLEHFSVGDLLHLLKDCRRVLKRGGQLSIVVPDAKMYVDAYLKEDLQAFRHQQCLYEFGLPFQTKMDFLNYIFYMDGHHRYMFDVDNMLALLRLCGFSDVTQREFDGRLDQEVRRSESIYFCAVR